MTLLDISYESCTASVLIERKNVAAVQGIMSKVQGQGHARGCIKKIEIIAKNYKVKEIWWPTVVNTRLEKLLLSLGYEFTNFGPHPEMPQNGDVTGYKKVL